MPRRLRVGAEKKTVIRWLPLAGKKVEGKGGGFFYYRKRKGVCIPAIIGTFQKGARKRGKNQWSLSEFPQKRKNASSTPLPLAPRKRNEEKGEGKGKSLASNAQEGRGVSPVALETDKRAREERTQGFREKRGKGVRETYRQRKERKTSTAAAPYLWERKEKKPGQKGGKRGSKRPLFQFM